jgi:Pvc16 N-terminal domain
MLDAALRFLAEETNAHLLRRTGSALGAVSLGPVVDATGALQLSPDSLRLTLFQVEEERAMREQVPERRLVGGREVLLPPPLRLNLVLLFSANFRVYEQGLRHMAHVLKFFAAQPLFTPASSPALPAGLDRLALDLISHGPEQLNQIWACLGARHLPHLLYRARVLALQDEEPLATGAPILTIDTRLQHLALPERRP